MKSWDLKRIRRILDSDRTTPWSQGKSFVVTRYIPDLSWHLVIDQDSEDTVHVIRDRLYQTILGIAVIISIVLFIITTVIRNFNKQITKLMEERENAFQQATEQLYDNIYELNITRNCTGNQRTAQYFESLGAQGLPMTRHCGS